MTQPKIKNVTLELYLKRNTRYIKRNWKDVFIREKYGYSHGQYIIAKEHRIANMFNINIEHPILKQWVRKMYATI